MRGNSISQSAEVELATLGKNRVGYVGPNGQGFRRQILVQLDAVQGVDLLVLVVDENTVLGDGEGYRSEGVALKILFPGVFLWTPSGFLSKSL